MIFPTDEELRRAADLLRAGKLVAFPTETVYGLGAHALDAGAVAEIFRVKGRPATSPLIVHVDSLAMARSLVAEWPAEADSLARRFWPGPLTLVLPKQSCIPGNVTAGLPTVGLRMPAHPVAQALIRTAGIPLAAPSANRFTQVSPTTAVHVRQGLGGDVALILDGGPTTVGIESTVLSLVVQPPVILRPGMLGRAEMEACIGPIRESVSYGAAHPSPGLHPRHYSPRTPLKLVRDGLLPPEGRGAYLFLRSPAPAAETRRMPAEARAYAQLLYATLHELDTLALDWIAVEAPPDTPEWAGILDRLSRASC